MSFIDIAHSIIKDNVVTVVVSMPFEAFDTITDAYFQEKLGYVPATFDFFKDDGLVYLNFDKMSELPDEEFEAMMLKIEELNLSNNELIEDARQLMANILGGQSADYPLYYDDGYVDMPIPLELAGKIFFGVQSLPPKAGE